MTNPIQPELQTIDNTITPQKQPKYMAPFWKRALLQILFWSAFILVSLYTLLIWIIIFAGFLGLIISMLPSTEMFFLLPTFWFGIVMFFYPITDRWMRDNKFPGFKCGIPATLIVWILGGIASIVQNWFCIRNFNSIPDLAVFSYLIPIIIIPFGIFLSCKVGKEGIVSTWIEKIATGIKCHRIAFVSSIIVIVLTSIIGQQVYYRNTTQFITFRGSGKNYQVFWNYFAYFDTSRCPFEKFPNLKSVTISRSMSFDFKRLSKLSSLKEIVIVGNHNMTQSDMKLLTQLSNLESLELQFWNKLKDSESTGLEFLPQIKTLRKLSLDVTEANIGDIHFLKDIPQLETLSLDYLYYWEEVDFESLQHAPKLKELLFYRAEKSEIERARKALPNCKITVERWVY